MEIKVDNISKTYELDNKDNLSELKISVLKLKEGEILGIMGRRFCKKLLF